MSENELLEPFERLLAETVPLSRVREIERGAPADDLWATLVDSGFLDAMVSEQHGGAGLSFAAVEPLIRCAGRYLLPVAFAETVVARALLANAGLARPEGPIVLVSLARADGGYRQGAVAFARHAQHALVAFDDQVAFEPLSRASVEPTGVHGSLAADIGWSSRPEMGVGLPLPASGLRALGASLRASLIAGAADQVLAVTVRYAGERAQFGKPIGKQQAIQQQLAVMAEQAVMASMAAQIGCANGFPPPSEAAAVAKQVSSAAVSTIAAIAHAVHGAIGMSEEYDLSVYIRRLYELRMADGSETFWAQRLGALRAGSRTASSVDFVRELWLGG